MSLTLVFIFLIAGWFIYYAVRDVQEERRIDRFREQRDRSTFTQQPPSEDQAVKREIARGPVPVSSEDREREYERQRRERDFALHMIHKAEIAQKVRRDR